ncbi:hypothetical protein VV02_12395 [Luteipulveratus mongoliensis]|uniref:Aminotransferase class V domain-containing protein n=2 Tax=Luteipulveratus mongoliensis TaxID=571913 RepID=A0A0K1JIS4_9MICO|nr:hypothetical protein VV02_12395 [Luteipulveratus mongoliensis]
MTEPLLHLQTAAAGRASEGTIASMTDHLALEASVGSYPAQAEAAPVLERAYRDLAGLLGVDEDGVALVGSATDALRTLLMTWPLPNGAAVGVVPAEWGPNVDAFIHHDLRPVLMDVDDRGVLDLDALQRTLRSSPPDVLHLTHLASHRCVSQPVVEAIALCRSAGVTVWVDAAQSLGHLDTAFGADAAYAPGRKWLAGPRGLGILAVRASARDQLTPFRTRTDADLSTIEALRKGERPVAAQVGLAHAVREHVQAGPSERRAALAAAGARLRQVMRDVPGWAVADPLDAVGAIVGLRPTDGQDVEAVQRRLARDHRILVTACLPWRSAEISEPLLRLAPAAALTADEMGCLTSGLG